MSDGPRVPYLSILGTLIVALMLTMMPLPEAARPFRPDWLALVLVFWVMMLPRGISVGAAWMAGVVLDVAQGTPLGQHALALCVIAAVTARFHLQMRVFPVSQMTAAVLALLSLYQFLLFWINGVAGVTAPAVAYWGPLITGTILWPILSVVLSGIRYRTPAGA